MSEPRQTHVRLTRGREGSIRVREVFRSPREWWRYRRDRVDMVAPADDPTGIVDYVRGLMRGQVTCVLPAEVHTDIGVVNIDPR